MFWAGWGQWHLDVLQGYPLKICTVNIASILQLVSNDTRMPWPYYQPESMTKSRKLGWMLSRMSCSQNIAFWDLFYHKRLDLSMLIETTVYSGLVIHFWELRYRKLRQGAGGLMGERQVTWFRKNREIRPKITAGRWHLHGMASGPMEVSFGMSQAELICLWVMVMVGRGRDWSELITLAGQQCLAHNLGCGHQNWMKLVCIDFYLAVDLLIWNWNWEVRSPLTLVLSQTTLQHILGPKV